MCVAQKLYCLNSTPNSGPCGMLSPGSSQVKWLWYIPTVENFDLTPAHTCAPISHAWLKNVSCCRLAWHNFQKYVNSDPCKERKPCVKWINDNTFLAISDFVDKRFLDNFAFGRLRTSSEDFGLLRKWSCRFQKSQHSQDKNLTPTSQKKLADIISSSRSLSRNK